jgi:alkylation response protein AidB-like acyl-CoA dehydrogenase
MELLEPLLIPEHAREVQQQAREFANEQIKPVAADYYKSGEYPWEVLEAGMQAGIVGQDIGEEYGGKGYDIHQMLVLSEELFRADAGIGLTMLLASFGAEMMEEHGSEELKERFLRPVAKNEQITGLAASEPETGSDLAGMTTTAEKDGDEYVVNGEKYWVGNGVEADWVTLYAKTGNDPDNRYGNYSLFAVPTDTDGYDAEHIPEKMAMRASKQAHIHFNEMRIPEENLIGQEGAGFYMLAEFFNFGRVTVGGQGIGLAAAALEEAWDFVHEREAFGRGISDFQSVQHRLADMRLEFESARGLVWRAADHVADREDAGFWASMAKVKGTEAATMCAENGMQLHGGRSILTKNRIARVYRDCRIPVIYEGANEVQRNLIYSQQ